MSANNCATCDYKKHPDGGHCYMFRTEPEGRCLKHTGLAKSVTLSAQAVMKIMLAVIPEVGPRQ